MLFELIAAVVAGIAVAGVAMSLRWVSRGRLPKWIVPAAGGIAMICYAIWSEYSWADRLANALPPGVVVAWKHADTSYLRPWSFYKPVVNRFTAVDVGGAKRNDKQPGQVMVNVILAARWRANTVVNVVFDCDGHRRADLVGDKVAIAEDGSITGVNWIDLPADDAVMAVACKPNGA